jgi:hypothetical protein
MRIGDDRDNSAAQDEAGDDANDRSAQRGNRDALAGHDG